MADTGSDVLIRNSVFPDSGTLSVGRRDWMTFLSGVVSGQLSASEQG
ncbi:DUF397 domain-containing protein [Dactylosporangium vinaceum]|nr:DUF397 domain-containing protein [Dactylosporangium vinaceum]